MKTFWCWFCAVAVLGFILAFCCGARQENHRAKAQAILLKSIIGAEAETNLPEKMAEMDAELARAGVTRAAIGLRAGDLERYWQDWHMARARLALQNIRYKLTKDVVAEIKQMDAELRRAGKTRLELGVLSDESVEYTWAVDLTRLVDDFLNKSCGEIREEMFEAKAEEIEKEMRAYYKYEARKAFAVLHVPTLEQGDEMLCLLRRSLQRGNLTLEQIGGSEEKLQELLRENPQITFPVFLARVQL